MSLAQDSLIASLASKLDMALITTTSKSVLDAKEELIFIKVVLSFGYINEGT